ncbi:MAG: prephenate dehydrogenase [Anaerolineales bacterium]
MNLTLVGLELVGTSVGLALKAVSDDLSIVGHDPHADSVKRAQELGAIDESHWNLLAACEEADLIFLDVDLEEIKTTLEALSGEIREGTVIVDTYALKRPVIEMARRLLSDNVHFVGGHVVSPRIRGDEEPAPDLLKGATFFLVAPEGVDSQAMDMASNLAEAVEAVPRYIDAAEHDGLVAATLQLPLLSALAMIDTLHQETGARERKEATGGALAGMVSLLSRSQALAAAPFLHNRENMLHWLDIYARRLDALRAALAGGEVEALEKEIARVRETGEEWMRDASSDKGQGEASGSGWRDLFLGGLGRR